MEPTKSISIALYFDPSTNVATQIRDALSKKCGQQQEKIDQRLYLYRHCKSIFEGVQLNIDSMEHSTTNYCIPTLHPVTGTMPDLIFVFNKCVGINKGLKKGDLVVIDQSDKTLIEHYLKDKVSIDKMLPELQVQGLDLEMAPKQILSLLKQSPMKGKDIQNALHVTDETRQQFLKDVWRPNVEKLWNLNEETGNFELTPQGLEEYQKLSARDLHASEGKPTVIVGSSECNPSTMMSTTDQRVDVIEQLSSTVFAVANHNRQKVMQISAVVCLEGGDIELSTPYNTIGEAMVTLMLKVSLAYAKSLT